MILLHRLTAHNFKHLTDVSLCFPDRGTILIKGANEAGKSSLFEAIFFALYGIPLITDRDFGVSALRKYGEDELRVELEFSIAGRRFQITRRVGGNHTARLQCPTKDGEIETIASITAVRARLGEELRLSATALLNTCFVEQKELGRLEEMEGSARRTAINELLNLRILTRLEVNFKVTPEDQNGVKLCRERLSVAHLDAALPGLEQDERATRNCLLYTQLREAEARREELQQRIVASQAERTKIAQERSVIAARLEMASGLRQRLHALEDILTLRVRAWRDAQGQEERARAEWKELAELAATLSARMTQQAVWEQLSQGLATLENLEAEAQTRQQELREQQGRIAAYEQVQVAWEAGCIRQQTLLAERGKRQRAADAADRGLEARNAMNQRGARLDHLWQQIGAQEIVVQEAAALQVRLTHTREEAERLPQRVIRRDKLGNLEERERQAALDRQEHERAEQEWEVIRQQQRDMDARQACIAALEKEYALQR